MRYIYTDQKARSNGYRQPENVDKGVGFPLEDVAERYFDIIIKHDFKLSAISIQLSAAGSRLPIADSLLSLQFWYHFY